MKVTIIISCFNEIETINKLLLKIHSINLNDLVKKIIVVDNCSSDRILEKIENEIII